MQCFPLPFLREIHTPTFPHTTSREGLPQELHDQGNQQCINSDSFCKGKTKNEVCTDGWLSFGVAPDGVECLTGGNTDTDTRADSSQANCQCHSEWMKIHDENPPLRTCTMCIFDS